MKKLILTILTATFALCATTSCEDMLDTSSNAYVTDKDHTLTSANDSMYSVMGILTQMQSLGERYVLFGEMRGDLVMVPSDAPMAYQRLNNYDNPSDDDILGSKRDYYSVINNCNIALSRMDTTITEHGVEVMLPEYAAIRTIRDWTYLQLGLIYGKASYTDSPVLNVDDAEKEIPSISLDELVGRLITDLEPFAMRNTPNYGTIDGQPSKQFFIKPALLLADLYLYNGNYERAAAMYYKVIRDGGYTVSYDNSNRWTTSVRTESVKSHYQTYTTETMAQIPYASDAKKYHPNTVNLTFSDKPAMTPAQWFVNEMNTMQHFHIDRLGITNISGYLEGDLRGMLTDRDGTNESSAFGTDVRQMRSTECLITKFAYNGSEYTSVVNPGNKLMEEGSILTRFISLYRIPHLYLRYAEAVNRAGKPSLAFAVIKYGLRRETLEDETIVDPDELADNMEWTNFTETMFDSNYGTAMRGRGLGIAVEKTDFILPATDSRDAIVEWVEERILDELAAETCFEGNRFFDLLRISRHRPAHPQFMAKMISRRFANPEQVEAKLTDISNMWVK